MPDKLALLRRIIIETGCRVVLTSEWRKHVSLLDRVRAEIKLHAITPNLDRPHGMIWSNPGRAAEIREWLFSNDEPRSFAILDDCEIAGFDLEEAFFKTETETGLTPEIAAQVIRRLNSDYPTSSQGNAQSVD